MEQTDIKVIENHIKDLLFKSAPISSEPSESNSDVKYNLTPFLYDSKCLLANVEDEVYKSKHMPPLPIDGSPGKNPNHSQLIDLNVLTDFAAKHAGVSRDVISNAPRILPHPDLENELPLFLGTSISKDHLTAYAHVDKPPGFKNISKVGTGGGVESSKKFQCDQKKTADDNASKAADKKNQRRARRSRKQAAAREMVRQRTPDASKANSPKKVSSKSEDSKRKENKPLSKEIPKTVQKKKEISSEKDEATSKNSLPEEAMVYSLFRFKNFYKFLCNVCEVEARTKDSYNRHLRSEMHKESIAQIEQDRILPFLPKPLPSQAEAITTVLYRLHAEFGLESQDLLIREKLGTKLREFVESEVPGCTLEMMGSSVTGFGLKSSLIDSILKVAPDHSIPNSLQQLYEKLKSDPAFFNVETEFKKKSPGIVFSDQETSLRCSIFYDKGVTEKFAKLLAMYTQLDPRVSVLGTCFRYWSNICGIDNQDRGTLPAYSYSILLVYFLQQVQPPVLPVLNELKEYGHADFVDDYLKGEKWKTENTDTIGELWIKLFHFYSFVYEMGNHVVCIRHARKVLCSEKNWTTKFYAIEDPFVRRNLAHVIPSYQVFQYIQQCFLRTYRYFVYPQIREGKINLQKDEGFDSFLLQQCYTSKKSVEDASDDESAASDNEDSLLDESSFLQDFEDQDPDLPIQDFVSALKDMDVGESNDGQNTERKQSTPDLDSSLQSCAKPESPKKDSRSKEKLAKQEDKKSLQHTCSWNIGDLQLNPDSFTYKMEATTFKGKKDLPFSCKSCKSSGHTKKNCPKDELPARSQLQEMNPDFLKMINKVLYYIRDKNCVDDEDRNFMTQIMRDIEDHIRKEFPEACLSMFGSFCNGFGFKTRSDMDFCLTFKGQEDGKLLDSTDVIEKIAKHLKQFPKLENIISVTSAKVPIVKFSCSESGLEGDISLYNTLALANTQMLEAYSKIDQRVQVLGFALKYFAKVLGICDASRGSLSSYAYILMVIFFLQQRQPPVIPVLQELHGEEKPSQLIDEWNVWHFKDYEKLPEIWPDYGKNRESAADLWLALLSFYAYDFDWKEFVISIRQRSVVTKFQKMWITNQLAIEDPFDLNHNLGAGLSHKMNMYILKTFVRGRERFGNPPNDLHTLYQHEVNYLFDRNFLNMGTEPPHDRGCRACGKIGHIVKNCPQERTCAFCKKPGHLVKQCPIKKQWTKKKQADRNMQDKFPAYDGHSVDVKNQHGHPLRAQGGDISRKSGMPLDLQSRISDDRDLSRKLIQMGYPTHRHPAPPPGFPKTFNSPPPGFNKPNFSMHPNGKNFPRMKYPVGPVPHMFQHMNELSQSPPKHYSSSPPKNYPRNNAYHKIPDPISPMGVHPSLLPDPHMPSVDSRNWQVRHPLPPNSYSQQKQRGVSKTEW